MALQFVIPASLTLTMSLFGVALLVAWARFGRHAHVAYWSAAFFATAGCNAIIFAMLLFPRAAPLDAAAATLLSLSSASLFSHGFRQRAGLSDCRGVVAATILMMIVNCALMLLRPDDYHNRAIINSCDAVLFALSAQAIRADPHDRDAPQRATFWMLASFSAYVAALAVLSLVSRTGGPVAPSVYELAYVLGAPAGLTGIGLFAMLLVASDLSGRLQRLASLDPLTGVLNRRGVDHAAGRMLAQCRRFDRCFSIVVADLDRFKSINDRFGHAMGDLVLQRFASHCEAVVREGDLVARLGGEEFIMVLADTGAQATAEVMERVRERLPAALADLALPVPVTASFGVATLGGREDTLAAMMVRADAALYRAKAQGRDRITIASPGGPDGTDPRFLAAFARTAEDAPRGAARL